jgi:hypothetical protein
MPVKKHYTAAEVQAAMDRADHQYYRKLVRVRNDVSVVDWAKASIKVPRDASGHQLDPYQWPGRGGDIGHTFRHVDATADPGKSIYQDRQTAILVTMELLNSAKGQDALEALDTLTPHGDERDMTAGPVNRKIVSAVTGDYYGAGGKGQPLQKIKTAVCEIMKLGADTLWIHSSYPKHFV